MSWVLRECGYFFLLGVFKHLLGLLLGVVLSVHLAQVIVIRYHVCVFEEYHRMCHVAFDAM